MPELALIDPDRAMKLIELTALPEEIKGLQTEALVLVADSDSETFHRLISEIGYANLVPDSINWLLDNYGICDVAAVASIAGKLPESMDKAEILIKLARRAHQLSGNSARELCRESLRILYELDLSQAEENASFHCSNRAAAMVRDVSRMCRT